MFNTKKKTNKILKNQQKKTNTISFFFNVKAWAQLKTFIQKNGKRFSTWQEFQDHYSDAPATASFLTLDDAELVVGNKLSKKLESLENLRLQHKMAEMEKRMEAPSNDKIMKAIKHSARPCMPITWLPSRPVKMSGQRSTVTPDLGRTEASNALRAMDDDLQEMEANISTGSAFPA